MREARWRVSNDLASFSCQAIRNWLNVVNSYHAMTLHQYVSFFGFVVLLSFVLGPFFLNVAFYMSPI